MKNTFILFCLIYSVRVSAQNYILPEGEFMDTTFISNPNCVYYYPSYYYSFHKKYPKSSATILSEVQNYLKLSDKVYVGSGYITFRFGVDCEGKTMPWIRVLQTDEKYNKTHFEKEFVSRLFDFFKTMDKWIPAKYKDSRPANYIAFITFKIKNGKVVNIIP